MKHIPKHNKNLIKQTCANMNNWIMKVYKKQKNGGHEHIQKTIMKSATNEHMQKHEQRKDVEKKKTKKDHHSK